MRILPDFQRALFFWSAPHPVRATVGAGRQPCAVPADAPFWGLFMVLGKGAVRLHPGRDRDVVTTTQRWGSASIPPGAPATGLRGLGHVAPTFGDIFKAKVQPAGGATQCTQSVPMHARLTTRGAVMAGSAVAEAFGGAGGSEWSRLGKSSEGIVVKRASQGEALVVACERRESNPDPLRDRILVLCVCEFRHVRNGLRIYGFVRGRPVVLGGCRDGARVIF